MRHKNTKKIMKKKDYKKERLPNPNKVAEEKPKKRLFKFGRLA